MIPCKPTEPLKQKKLKKNSNFTKKACKMTANIKQPTFKKIELNGYLKCKQAQKDFQRRKGMLRFWDESC